MNKFFNLIVFFFFIIVCFLLFKTLSQIQWEIVAQGLSKFSLFILLQALLLVFIDYAILSSFDLMGMRYLKIKTLSSFKVLISAFSCYVFNLNLGALVGGMGFRFKIYSGWGVSKSNISKVVLFSSFTNWLGHAFLLSTVFCFQNESVATLFDLPSWLFYLIGIFQYIMILIYLYFSMKRKKIVFKKSEWIFPRLRLAFFQMIISSFQWVTLSLIIYILIKFLGHNIGFGKILFTSLVASIAGVLTHIPGGLGVLETIYLKVNLGIPKEDLLAALISYRFVYYLFPLFTAIPCYLGIEYYQRKGPRITI
jgi:uncharacterized membrane protein YbhN (UPF0104 family)